MGFWGDAWNATKIGLAPVSGGASLLLPGGGDDKKKKAPVGAAPEKPGGVPAFGATPNAGTASWYAGQNGTQPPQQQGQQNWWQQPPQQQPPPKPGKNGHTATTAPYGMDQSAPGAAEQNWQNNQDMWYNKPQMDWASSQLPAFGEEGFGETYNKENVNSFGKPGEGQQYWDGISGQFNEVGKYNQPNLAAESYQRTVQNLPGSIQPTFDAAFDRARDKSVGAANSQASARGAYGSSASLNGVNSVISDIEAARANRAGDFALQDSANQRNWLDSAANQGRSADLTGLGIHGSNLAGVKTFGDMAFNAEDADLARDKFASDTAFGVQGAEQTRLGQGIDAALGIDSQQLNRLNSGQNAASSAQGARETRIGNLADVNRNQQNDMVNFLRQQYGDMFAGDDAAFQEWANGVLGVTNNAKNDDQRSEKQLSDNLQQFTDIVPGIGGASPKARG
jgi:hypothetical protein